MKEIFKGFDKAGYNTQLFLMNAAFMGVPQKRERVFFISTRKDLKLPKIKLAFNEKPIPLRDITNIIGKPLSEFMKKNYWDHKKESDKSLADTSLRITGKKTCFNSFYLRGSDICNTIISTEGACLVLHSHPNILSDEALAQIGSFPLDYNFNGIKVKYLIGMSVPPVMTAQIATAVKEQLFNA